MNPTASPKYSLTKTTSSPEPLGNFRENICFESNTAFQGLTTDKISGISGKHQIYQINKN